MKKDTDAIIVRSGRPRDDPKRTYKIEAVRLFDERKQSLTPPPARKSLRRSRPAYYKPENMP